MREFRTYGSVRGALSNERPYRDSRPQEARRMRAVPGDALQLSRVFGRIASPRTTAARPNLSRSASIAVSRAFSRA